MHLSHSHPYVTLVHLSHGLKGMMMPVLSQHHPDKICESRSNVRSAIPLVLELYLYEKRVRSRQSAASNQFDAGHTKVLIERTQFCRVQYLILSRYAEEKDKAYDKLVKFTKQLDESAKLSLILSQKRLKKDLANYRHWATNVAPPTTNERNVPITAKTTSDIFSNNARSQVCGSRELSAQKSNFDHSLVESKSEYFPKNAHRNGPEVAQTPSYYYPQPEEPKSPKNSQFKVKRLKKYHAKYCNLPTNVAPPTTSERNVSMTATQTSDILSNNARSQVCGWRELSAQNLNHDRSSLVESKSEYFPKNANRNEAEVPQTSIYDYPQPIGRKSEYFPKNSQPQLDQVKSDYSSKKSHSNHRSSILWADTSDASFFPKKRLVDENIWLEKPICDYSQQKRLPTELSSADAQSWTRISRSLIDTRSINDRQWENCATKLFPPNLQPAGAEWQDFHLHNKRLIPSIKHRDQQYQCTMTYAPGNTEYRARAIIDLPKDSEPMYEKILYMCNGCGKLHYGQIMKS